MTTTRVLTGLLALELAMGFSTSCGESADTAPVPGAAAGAAPAVPELLTRGAHGCVSAGLLAPGASALFVLPTQSRSERVVRARVASRGVGLCVRAPASLDHLRVRALEHADDSQVLLDGGTRPVLVGPPRLPSVEPLPVLARQDGIGAPGVLEVDLAGGLGQAERVVALFLGSDASADPAPRRARSCALFDSLPARIDPGALTTDQVFAARVEQLPEAGWLEQTLLEATAGGRDARELVAAPDGRTVGGDADLDLWFAPPAPRAPGRTVTLLVETLLTDASRAETSTLDAGSSAVVARPAPLGWFRDVAAERGVTFVHLEGPDLQLDIRPTMGPGLAWGDIDGDGLVDLYLTQGSGRAEAEPPRDRLFKNRGQDFDDVTAAAGIADEAAGMGALFLDVEGDGDLDLYVANDGRDRLWRNDAVGGARGGGRFTDASADAGLAGERWHAGVCAADTDGDGDLEIYVASYLDFSARIPDEELERYQREDPVAMLPFAFPGEVDTFYVNESADGSIRLRDATEELGLVDPAGRGMQPIFWDYDRDGDQDLYVANDVSNNQLYRNEGPGAWKNVSFGSGLDDPRGCMGLAVGDVDGDLDEDLMVTNWQLEANALYVNNLVAHASPRSRVGSFRDEIVQRGLAQAGIGVTKWGVELADLDADGDLDLFYVNGYTSPDYESTGICVGQPCHLFENLGPGDGDGSFERRLDPALDVERAHRAAAACDFDQDGDLDIAVSSNNGPFRLLENARDGGHWILVRLRGRGRNTHAVGAELTLRAGALVQRRSLRAGSSYLAGNPSEIFFGLGEARAIDELAVRWPDGSESRHAVDGIDRVLTIEQGE